MASIISRYVLDYLNIKHFEQTAAQEWTYRPESTTRTINGICCIRTGEAIFYELDSSRSISAHSGDLILLPMGIPYKIRWMPGQQIYDTVNFIFNLSCYLDNNDRGQSSIDTRRMSRRDIMPPFLPSDHIIRIPDSSAYRLARILTDLCETKDALDSYTAFTVNMHFYHLLDYIHSALYPSRNQPSGSAIDTARLYIEAHCTDDLTVAEMAKRFSMSCSHFSRSFKAATGMSPGEYRSHARMELAADLLRNTNRSVAEIVMILGFTSEAHFRECFRRFSGVSPLRFRKENLQRQPNEPIGSIAIG